MHRNVYRSKPHPVNIAPAPALKFCQQWSCLAFRILALTTGSCAFSQPEREKVKHDSPCPIRMFANNGRATKCGEIYCYVCMFANNGRATTFLVGVY